MKCMPLKRISDSLGILINALAQVFPDMNSIFDPLTGKTTLIFAFRQGFQGPDEVNYVAKTTAF
jgi:hypothetical protein